MIRLYLIGLAILIIAIVANAMVIKLGIKSWYDFIEMLTQQGMTAFKNLSIIDYIWLFIGYPMVLGFGYWLGDKIHNVMFL
ncbi:DUF7672 family protein [Winogradskyella aurantia]|uniref:Uncharacterized protein n=1 Tax=Winogradskyella aurantia TaxID=1915063 RepID=A0A265UUU8_9FLAO|nr:hypothetical protein [Winogradskyella aurantia]OZV69060.1 hypothetical protein CA834_06245 [Winogradskyella aurantia]